MTKFVKSTVSLENLSFYTTSKKLKVLGKHTAGMCFHLGNFNNMHFSPPPKKVINS